MAEGWTKVAETPKGWTRVESIPGMERLGALPTAGQPPAMAIPGAPQRLNARTGLPMVDMPMGSVPVLDMPYNGAMRMNSGALLAQKPGKLAAGTSEMIRGGMEAVAPFALPAAALTVGPGVLAAGMATGAGAQHVVEGGLNAIGADPGSAALSGDIAGLVAGAKGPQIAARVGDLASKINPMESVVNAARFVRHPIRTTLQAVADAVVDRADAKAGAQTSKTNFDDLIKKGTEAGQAASDARPTPSNRTGGPKQAEPTPKARSEAEKRYRDLKERAAAAKQAEAEAQNPSELVNIDENGMEYRLDAKTVKQFMDTYGYSIEKIAENYGHSVEDVKRLVIPQAIESPIDSLTPQRRWEILQSDLAFKEKLKNSGSDAFPDLPKMESAIPEWKGKPLEDLTPAEINQAPPKVARAALGALQRKILQGPKRGDRAKPTASPAIETPAETKPVENIPSSQPQSVAEMSKAEKVKYYSKGMNVEETPLADATGNITAAEAIEAIRRNYKTNGLADYFKEKGLTEKQAKALTDESWQEAVDVINARRESAINSGKAEGEYYKHDFPSDQSKGEAAWKLKFQNESTSLRTALEAEFKTRKQEAKKELAAQPSPGEAAFQARKTAKEAEKPETVRVYRGQQTESAGKPAPDWMNDHEKYQKSKAATGRWWTEDPERADWYAKDAGDSGKIFYQDIPIEVVQKSRVKNIPEALKFSADPENELFLPSEYADSSKWIEHKKGPITSPGEAKFQERKALNALPAKEKISSPAKVIEPEIYSMERPKVAGDYQRAKTHSDGLIIRDKVPNLRSIESSLSQYEELPGIRNIPISEFTESKYASVGDNQRVADLAGQIKENGEINPLIVVIDKEGPYILEGGHRLGALQKLGKKVLPAKVVIDTESLQDWVPIKESAKSPAEVASQARKKGKK